MEWIVLILFIMELTNIDDIGMELYHACGKLTALWLRMHGMLSFVRPLNISVGEIYARLHDEKYSAG